MASTPMAAVNQHMDAINAKDREELAASVVFPFLHMQPDGEKLWFKSAAELPDPAGAPFRRSEIAAIEILASSGDVIVYRLTFQRYGENDEPTLRVKGLWGVQRIGEGWTIGWRQYLGEI